MKKRENEVFCPNPLSKENIFLGFIPAIQFNEDAQKRISSGHLNIARKIIEKHEAILRGECRRLS
jgi:hypothetical protein